MAFDNHPAIKTLTAARASEAVALAPLPAPQAPAAEPARQLVTCAHLQAQIAALEIRLTGRPITGAIAIPSIAVAPLVTLPLAALPLLN